MTTILFSIVVTIGAISVDPQIVGRPLFAVQHPSGRIDRVGHLLVFRWKVRPTGAVNRADCNRQRDCQNTNSNPVALTGQRRFLIVTLTGAIDPANATVRRESTVQLHFTLKGVND